MDKEKRLELIKDDLENSSHILNALCNENRKNILLCLLDNCSNGGIQVQDIAKKINLSRPAVSHHLKVLLDEEIVSIEKSGTKNFYHITGIDKILSLRSLLENILLYVEERNESKWKI